LTFIGVHFIISFSLICRLDLADCIFKSSTKYIFARVQAHGRKKFAQICPNLPKKQIAPKKICPKSKFFSLPKKQIFFAGDSMLVRWYVGDFEILFRINKGYAGTLTILRQV